MPECLLLSYFDNLDRLRAERLLDAAQAGSVPHLEDAARTSWYRATERRTARRLVAPSSTGGLAAPFTINGTPADKQGLMRWLSATFGVLPATVGGS